MFSINHVWWTPCSEGLVVQVHSDMQHVRQVQCIERLLAYKRGWLT